MKVTMEPINYGLYYGLLYGLQHPPPCKICCSGSSGSTWRARVVSLLLEAGRLRKYYMKASKAEAYLLASCLAFREPFWGIQGIRQWVLKSESGMTSCLKRKKNILILPNSHFWKIQNYYYKNDNNGLKSFLLLQ